MLLLCCLQKFESFTLRKFVTYWKRGAAEVIGMTPVEVENTEAGTCYKAQEAQLRALWWPGGVGWWGMGGPQGGNICTHVADSLHCMVETNTASQSNSYPIKNSMLEKYSTRRVSWIQQVAYGAQRRCHMSWILWEDWGSDRIGQKRNSRLRKLFEKQHEWWWG